MNVLVWPVSHIYAHNQMSEKKKLAELLSLEVVTILAYFFVLYGYQKHERCG